jgi:hypothetical protein
MNCYLLSSTSRTKIATLPALVMPALSLIATFLLAGCGGNLMAHSVAQVAQVSEVTACEAQSPASCAGLFGFAIDNMGNFTAGPSPTGKTVTGTITPAELSSLQAALGPLVQSSSMHCDNQSVIPGVGDKISASFTDGSQADLFVVGGQTCFRSDQAHAAAFSDLFHQLLTKYYPNPFPA